MDDINISQPSTDDGYLIDVTEASEILGVSRTRLSQLTTKGEFSFQRRKIGTRNRLFYKRSDLYSYLRDQSRTVEGLRDPRQARILGASSQSVGQSVPFQLEESLDPLSPLHISQQNENLVHHTPQNKRAFYGAGVHFQKQQKHQKFPQNSASALKQRQCLSESIESIQTAIASLGEIIRTHDKGLSALSRQISALNVKSKNQNSRSFQPAACSDFPLSHKAKLESAHSENETDLYMPTAPSKLKPKKRPHGKSASPRIRLSVFR